MNNGLTTCKACGEPLFQLSGGHRRREYCNDNCKQAAYRRRQEEKRKAQVRQRWAGYSEQTQNQLEWLMNKYGCDFAKMVAGLICTERAYVPQSSVADEVLQERVIELEQQLSNLEQQLVKYRQVIDLDAICPWTALTPVQEYLRDSDEAVPFTRRGKTIRIVAIDNHGRAVSEHHGLTRLNDDEIEQCRLYVLQKLGRPIIVTVRPVGDGREGSEPCEAGEQSELQQAQAHMLELEQQLAKYRQICDLSDRARLEQQLLDIGEQIGYRRLIPADNDMAVGEGSEFWRAFAESADDDMLARTLVRARQYAENLVWIDAQTQLKQAERRIAELERQLAQSALQTAS